MDKDGLCLNTRKEIADWITNHFGNIAITVQPNIDRKMINLIPTCINDCDNNMLCSMPTEIEIKNVLFAMEPDKIPGLDGFPPTFFQQNWSIVGNELIHMIQNFFRTGFLAKELNTSFISLIPKTINPNTPAEFRPIALSNTTYKIVAKLMANRMKGLLDKIISPYRSAFIPGRQVTDNITITHEIIHKMRKSRGKWFDGLKNDMSKAFDKFEWNFLMEIMKKLGFSETWCNMVFQCISTTSLSVLLNGSPTEFFKPTRGLRQGDPLSPYLFLFCMEAMSRTILNAEENGDLKGIKISRYAPSVSHLLFADDCIIFCKADLKTCHKLVSLFKDFGTNSGQLVNLSKSGVFFSPKTNPDKIRRVKEILGVNSIPLNDRYLGSSLFTNISKVKIFEPLIKNMTKRLKGWNGQNVNSAGRTVMVKNVRSSLAVYQMNCFKIPKKMNYFKIPKKISKTLYNLQRDYWWGKDENGKNTNGKKGIYLKAWESMCKSLEDGGLGI